MTMRTVGGLVEVGDEQAVSLLSDGPGRPRLCTTQRFWLLCATTTLEQHYNTMYVDAYYILGLDSLVNVPEGHNSSQSDF